MNVFQRRVAYWWKSAKIIASSRITWGYIAVVAVAMTTIAPSPPQPVALVMNGLLAALAFVLALNWSNAVVEIIEPRDPDTGEPCPRTAGHWLAFSVFQIWFFLFLRTLYSYVFNFLDRPPWMANLPIINMLLVLLVLSAVIQIVIPLMVRDDDDRLVVRAGNLDSSRAVQLAVIAIIMVASVAIWFAS